MPTLRLIEEHEIAPNLESAVQRREDAVELALMVRRLRPVASISELRAALPGLPSDRFDEAALELIELGLVVPFCDRDPSTLGPGEAVWIDGTAICFLAPRAA
jgi:hypothetical protein